ncbi:MAG: rhodanese-like domain-containing protein [Usitatibacter sp.]
MSDFLMNNLALVGLFLASGLMLVWPEIMKLAGGGGEGAVGTLEATRLMNQNGSLIIDVRDEKDFANGHLPRARHIPVRELAGRMDEIKRFKDKPVLVTDQGGTRAAAAARLLRQSGFTKVAQLKGGIAAWQQASLPVEK